HNADFVLGAITELLKVGSVVQCPCPPVVVNPLSVSIQPNGKKRLILDLRHVNFFVKKSKIKSDLFKSGFVANKDKCQWFPLQVICWLGIFWDFKNNRMFIPPEKISGILDEVVEIM
ncbi:unnamed protein product, partial [Porites evermanni]